MKIAMYKNTDYGITTVMKEEQGKIFGYIRMTEFVEVDFTGLPFSETSPQEIKVIDEQIKGVKSEFTDKLAQLESRKSELLSIGCDK